MFTATLIAADRLSQGDISEAGARLAQAGLVLVGNTAIEAGKAHDFSFTGDLATARKALEDAFNGVDAIVQPTANRLKKLIIADMDSTMITIECIDELADYAGIKPQIAEVTERAMRGELDFEEALRSRVALLKGLPETVIAQCLKERVVIMPGAKALVRTIKANGGHAILVSGGFTRFAEPVAAEIGFDRAVANVVGIADGKLDGTVHGAIVGAQTKLETLRSVLAEQGWDAHESLAVGDGANDIPMIEAAGLGVAYHAKPKTRAAAAAAVSCGDLSTILYAMGIARKDWASAE